MHTPAPWTVESDGTTISMAGQAVIISPAPDQTPRDEVKANSRLIASAPELLAACKVALAQFKNIETEADWVQELAKAVNKAETKI